MTNIKVYKHEIEAGLSTQISNNVLSFASDITSLKTPPEQTEIFLSVAKANKDQPDLIHRYAILASVGWNGNDDVFDGAELWQAKSTPVDKQVNFMHNEMNIIGHMTEAFGLDENGSLLDSSLDASKLPSRFDIGVGFVLYTLWENEERAALVSKVVGEIDSGNWFVSMECRFPDFDYAVIDKDGHAKTIARNESTSFLSKHLRAYGGAGQYQDYKVGRLLKGLFFSGKGIVDNPANKRSIIFTKTEPFTSKGQLNLRENKMDEKEIAALKARLDSAEADNKRLSTELTEKAKAAVNSEIDSLKSQLVESAKATEVAKADKVEADKNLSKALAEAKELSDKLAKANDEIGKSKAEAIKVSRVAQLVKAGLDEAKATETYVKWQSVGDEQFADIVSLTKAAFPCEDKKEPDADDEKKKADDKAKADAAEKVKADLAKAELEKAKAGNSDATKNDINTLAQRLARFMPKASAALASQTKE